MVQIIKFVKCGKIPIVRFDAQNKSKVYLQRERKLKTKISQVSRKVSTIKSKLYYKQKSFYAFGIR